MPRSPPAPGLPRGSGFLRANGIKHGLCSLVVRPEDPLHLQARSDDIFDALVPQNQYQAWACDQATVVSLRIDRVIRMERCVRDKVSLRAELDWDGDRRLEVEVLAGLLSRRPAETVEALRQTPHGCEWLMSRWGMLAHAADLQENTWTEGQTSMAFDLLATPTIFRIGKPGADLDMYGNVMVEAKDSATVARGMIAELEARRQVVSEIDEVERSLTTADLSGDIGPELRRLRRYEASLTKRLRWLIDQVNGKPDQSRGRSSPSLRAPLPPRRPSPPRLPSRSRPRRSPRRPRLATTTRTRRRRPSTWSPTRSRHPGRSATCRRSSSVGGRRGWPRPKLAERPSRRETRPPERLNGRRGSGGLEMIADRIGLVNCCALIQRIVNLSNMRRFSGDRREVGRARMGRKSGMRGVRRGAWVRIRGRWERTHPSLPSEATRRGGPRPPPVG